MGSEEWEGVSLVKGVGKVCQACGPTPGLSIVPWGIERNPYGSCRKSWRRIVVRVLTNPPRKGLVSSCGTYTGQQNSENCWVSPACLTSESHLAQGHLLKLPASGDRVRQGYRGTAIWPGEMALTHEFLGTFVESASQFNCFLGPTCFCPLPFTGVDP